MSSSPPPVYGTNPPLLESYANSSYSELFRLSATVLSDLHLYGQKNGYLWVPDIGALVRHCPNLWTDISFCFAGALLLTIFRLVFGHILMNQILIPLNLVLPKNNARFMESAYTTIIATIATVYAFTLEWENQYLAHPHLFWEDFSFTSTMPASTWTLYLLEVSHYLHSILAVLFINVWNNVDSIAMLVHHVFAILLLAISYLTKTYRLGVLVLCLHDICDIILEGTKCMLKLELTSPWATKVRDIIKVSAFVSLLTCWFVFRLYLYPMRVIYPAVLYSTTNSVESWFPLSLALFFLLWLILVLNAYWAMLLLKILFKAIFEGADEIEDPRDVEEVAQRESLKAQTTKKSKRSKKAD